MTKEAYQKLKEKGENPLQKAWDASIKSRKGKPAWNKGLTKETDTRVRNHSKSITGKKRPDVGKRNTQLYTGEKNPQWKHGKSIIYPNEFLQKRKNIRKRDCSTCILCYLDGIKKENKKKLSVHHIDEDKLNCNDINLLSLCNKHHGKLSGKKKEIYNDFFRIINQRKKLKEFLIYHQRINIDKNNFLKKYLR